MQNDYILENCDNNYHTKFFSGEDGNWSTGENVTDDDGNYNGHQFTTNAIAGTAHWSAGVTHNIYKNIFGLEGMGGNYNGLRNYVWHDSEVSTGPRFEGDHKTKRIYIGAWEAWNLLDVFAHEWTHGVVQESSDLGVDGESGALYESFGDIFGKIIEHREATEWTSNGVFHPANAGVNFTWELAFEGGVATRSLSNPNSFMDPDTYGGVHWCSASTGCNNHSQGGVQNHWFFLLSEGDASVQYLTGIGINKASRITFRNMFNYIQENSNYQDSRLGSIQAAREIYGRCSDEDFQTQLAWEEVGVGQAEWCSSLIGPRLICLDSEADITLASYQINAPNNAQITWVDLDPSWTYQISGADGEYLTISDFGHPEEFDCVNIRAVVTFRGQTRISIMRVCFENCEFPFKVGELSNVSNSINNSIAILAENSDQESNMAGNLIEVYPNPVANVFYIQSNSHLPSTLILYDILGHEVILGSIVYGKNQITSSSNLGNGVYFLKILNSEGKCLHLDKLIFNN